MRVASYTSYHCVSMKNSSLPYEGQTAVTQGKYRYDKLSRNIGSTSLSQASPAHSSHHSTHAALLLSAFSRVSLGGVKGSVDYRRDAMGFLSPLPPWYLPFDLGVDIVGPAHREEQCYASPVLSRHAAPAQHG